MKIHSLRYCMVGLVVAAIQVAAIGQEAPSIKQIGIGEVAMTKAVRDRASATNQATSINHLADSLNEHLLVSFQQSNKFKIIAKQDLSRIMDDQSIPSGAVRDPSDLKSLPGKIKGLDYLVLGAITDFKDLNQGIDVPGAGMSVSQRVVQTTVILKIYDATTGELVSAIDVPVRQELKGTSRTAGTGFNNGSPDDSIIEGVVKELSERSTLRVIDAIYPPKIAQAANGTVYINRGEGSGIQRDQVWGVFTAGAEIRDPDTGRLIGKEESNVGEVRITDVMQTMSKGMILGDNRGIAAGALVRLKADSMPPPPPPQR